MGGWLLVLAGSGVWLGILWQGAAGSHPSMGQGILRLATGAAMMAVCAIVRAIGRSPHLEPGRRVRGRAVMGLVIAVGFVLLGSGWSELHDARIAGSPVAGMSGRPVRLWGAIDTDPEETTFGWSASVRTEILLPPGLETATGVRTSSLVWVRGSGPAPRLTRGDRVEVEGLVDVPDGPFGTALRRQGYAASIRATDVRYRGPPTSLTLRAANAIRASLRGSLRQALPAREAGLVMGLALGDTSHLDLDTEDAFRATGLSHLVAVSGANVAMFLAPILGLATLVGFGSRVKAAVAVGAVGFFVVLTRAEPSVLRAGVMTGLTMLGLFLGRPRSPPAIVGGSVLGLLTLDPTLAHSIGFQLSVAATAGMLLLAGPVAGLVRFLPNGIALAAGATLGAQAGVTPLLLFHFGVVPTVSLPANLLAFPAVGAAMLLGLAAGVGGLAWDPLGQAIGGLARLPLGYLESVADGLARSPLPSITSTGGQLSTLLMGLAAVGAAGWWIRSGKRIPRRAVLAMVIAAPALLWASAVRAGPPGSLTAVFFDVGQGDAALIRSPGGAAILIDGGPDELTVARKLAALGIRRIDLMVATHPHADHVDGLPAVLRRFRVAMVIDSGCGGDSPFYVTFLQAVKDSGVPFRHPTEDAVIQVGDVRLDVLGPDRCYEGTSSDANNHSMVVRASLGPVAILFTGDAEQPSQEDLMDDHADGLRATVLKVPHHGGATTVEGFFEAIRPAVAVVSVGPNRYGHPVPEVIHALLALDASVFRTDVAGDITIRFDGSGVLIESERG